MNQKLSCDALITELAASDPIDEQILTDRIGPVAGDVIAEITAGSAEAPAGTRPALTVGASASVAPLRRRTWPLIAAAACLAVIAVTAAVVALLPGTSEPAYAITLDGEVVVVNWVRDLRDGSAIGEGLAAYGVDATVRAVPASPSRVGRVLTVAVNGVEAGEMPPGVSWGADGTDEVFTWRIDPTQFRDSIQIEIGVEPEPDEPYVVAESASLGILGGVLGTALGLTAVIAIALLRGWSPVIEPALLLWAPLLGLATGAAAGLYPARKATRIEPTEALRGR